MAASAASGESPAETVSPDGQARYLCGAERDSAAGCFNAWTRISHDGTTGGWIPAYCRDHPDGDNTGHCYGGAVPWWWWNGSGRDDAHRLPGPHHCYVAKGSVFCMQLMEP